MKTYNLYSWEGECWKCKQNTPRVIAANPDYEFNAVDVDENWCMMLGGVTDEK